MQDVFVPNTLKGTPRRVYIRRGVELQKYGYTDGCEACDAAKAKTNAYGHTEECRARLEAAMRQDFTERIEIARERRAQGKAAAAGQGTTDNRTRATSRVYIRRSDLLRVGYTEHCPGCKAARQKRPTSFNHNEACRRRIERKLLDDSTAAKRVQRARCKQGEKTVGCEVAAPVRKRPAKRLRW